MNLARLGETLLAQRRAGNCDPVGVVQLQGPHRQVEVMAAKVRDGTAAEIKPATPLSRMVNAGFVRPRRRRTQVIELEQNLRSGEVVLSMDVLTFLKDWLQNHILKADKAYSRHLTAHGVRQTDSPDAHNDRDVA